MRGPRDRTASAYSQFFAFLFAEFRFRGSRELRRTDLFEATMQGWARLDPARRHRFFEAFVRAAMERIG